MNSGMEFKKMFSRKQAGSHREETKSVKREEDRRTRIEDLVIRRKTILDLQFSILDLRLFVVLFL
jgi:hypothetical protein